MPEIIRMSGDDVDGLPPVGASPVAPQTPPVEAKKDEPKPAAPAATPEKKEEPKPTAPVAEAKKVEPKAPSERFLGDLTDAEVDQTLAELAHVSTQAERMQALSAPLSKAQLDYIAETAKKLGKPLTSEAKPGEKPAEPAKAPEKKEEPKPAAPAAKVDPLLANLPPEIRAHVEKMQAERDAAIKKADAESRKAETIMQEKRAETVKRQRAELFSTARAQGVPEDVLEDVWTNAVALRRSSKDLTHASVGDIITAVRQKKPSLFRDAPVKPEAKPAKPEKKQEEVRMTPRANPPHSGQTPPALPKPVAAQSLDGVNSLTDAAEKMRQRGRTLFGGN